MELSIDICINESCKITVEDLTIDYQSEYNTNSMLNSFRYSDTVSIDVLQHIKTDGTELQSGVITPHSGKTCPVTLPVEFDGWFKVHHIVIPTREWVEKELEKEELSLTKLYKYTYYSDGEKIYKIFNGKPYEASLEELVEINTEGTTISRVSKDYVSICFLRKCYINLCQQIFNSRAFDKCQNKNKVDSELVFKRDMVWMAINVIKYMTEFGQLHEVARLIERLTSCNGLCTNVVSTKNSGCGCSKKYGM